MKNPTTPAERYANRQARRARAATRHQVRRHGMSGDTRQHLQRAAISAARARKIARQEIATATA